MKKALITLIILGGLLFLVMAAINSKRGSEKSASIEVWLMQPVSQLKGHAWPTRADGQPSEITAIETPADVKLHLPSGREISLHSKAVTLHQDNGLITEVSILPLAEAASFQQTVAEAQRIASELKVDTDAQLRQKLDTWRASNPEPDAFANYGARTELERGVLLVFTIKAQTNGRGWFLVLDFTKPANAST